MFVSAILLAAGESTRMGRQKALVAWEGTTLLEYQLTQLSSIDEIEQIVVVTGHNPEGISAIAARFARACIAYNEQYATGKVSSILAGLRALSADADAIMLLAVDQPRPAGILRTLLVRHAEERTAITVPSRNGRRGHPIVFSRALLPELLAISEASLGIRAVMRDHTADTIEVEIDDPAIHVDLNRPSDLP
jgi:molybdenum cofactor cytidylyltransferase